MTAVQAPPAPSDHHHHLRMYASPVATLPPAAASRDAVAATMSRVPIAALLSRDNNNNNTMITERVAFEGRSYYRFGDDMYNFPSDDTEFERLDIIHSLIYLVALNKQLHLAALRSNPRRILDVGFGTGYWMFDIEKLYPNAQVIGIDLDDSIGDVAESRSVFKAPVDFNAPIWPVEDSSVDLVHMAQLCGCVPDWLSHYGKAYRCLRPGTGQLEHVEIDWTPRTHEPSFPPAAIDIYNWWYWIHQASERAGKPIAYREDTEDLLERAGFVDVSHKRVRIPLYCDGRKDKREWALAHAYQTAMGHTGTQSFTGFSMALFTKHLGFTPQQVYDICAKVVKVIGERDLPLYINLHVWTARRPQS